MEIGDRIRARREELGMTQDELARAIGYKSRSSINKIEIDGRGLPQKKVADIARALRVSPAYLMGWEETDYAVSLDSGNALVERISRLSEQNKRAVVHIVDALLANQGEKHD